MKVGIFFKVANDLLIDSTTLETAEPYGEALQYGGHYDFHETLEPSTPVERRFKSHDYDYYPRGRVVFFPKLNKFILYADPCLIEEDMVRVITIFGLDGQVVDVASDEHYRCKNCNSFYAE